MLRPSGTRRRDCRPGHRSRRLDCGSRHLGLLLYDLGSERIIEEPATIDSAIHCEPETPRHCALPHTTLADVRAKIEKHLKNGYFKQVQAPVGVTPQLIAWMELN